MTPIRVRCTVEAMNYSACGMRVGDSFDIGPDGLEVPEGQAFCWFAIASVLALLSGRIDDEGWLDRQPLVACPDPPEALHMRLKRIGA
jgi:uncharacterized repeat protein (TIGR04076 family)